MQLDLSRITLGTPFNLRHAAVASPDGPAPTMTGPHTTSLDDGDGDGDDADEDEDEDEEDLLLILSMK